MGRKHDKSRVYGTRGDTHYCVRCLNVATGGKPYCHKHVMEMTYAQKVRAALARLGLLGTVERAS